MTKICTRLLALLVFLPMLGFGQVGFQIAPDFFPQFTDSNGKPLAGGFVYSFSAGSSTPLATYCDNIGTANTNPIILDSSGRPQSGSGASCGIYLSQNSYKFCVQNSSAVQIGCRDNVQNISQVLLTTANTWTLGQTFNGLINFLGGTSDTTAAEGNVFYRTDLHRLRLYDGTAWRSLIGADSTDTLTNKTYDTAGSGNVFKINGTQVSAVTGTGSAVLGTSPSVTSPTLIEGACASGSSGNDPLCADPTDHLLHYNPNNGGLQQVPFTQFLTSAYTNATTTFSNVFGTNPAVAFARNYTYRCELIFQGSVTTAGPKFQVTGPAALSGLALSVDGATNATAYANAIVMGTTTPNTALGTLGTGTTNFIAHIVIGIQGGANSGTIALQAAANGAGTLTIQPQSFCVLQ